MSKASSRTRAAVLRSYAQSSFGLSASPLTMDAGYRYGSCNIFILLQYVPAFPNEILVYVINRGRTDKTCSYVPFSAIL
jgi:hypothetical protein